MEDRGAIICFQKFTTELCNTDAKSDSKADGTLPKHLEGPVCLGYFNRVEVSGIQSFREYVQYASKHQASYACSRKQLLLRKRDGLHEDIEISDPEDAKAGKLPFRSVYESENYRMGCCSVFTIRDGKCSRKSDECKTRKNFAKELYNKIKTIQHDGNFRFAIMELLGTEDLCLIVLANHYDNISNVIKVVQSFSCGLGTQNDECGTRCIIDNGHSILMLDRNDAYTAEDMWGDTEACVNFSLRSAAGLRYLRKVEQELNEAGILREGERITLNGCSGEYDAIMCCPARLVMTKFFGEKGCFYPGNPEYKKSVYQSETFVYPIGIDNACNPPDELPDEIESKLKTALKDVLENAVDELQRLFGYKKDGQDDTDPDFDYIELPIWRLLKDYWSFASFPLNKDLQEDLKIQLVASVNAIVEVAKECINARNTDDFLKRYDKIVDALRASMQAGSQQDRWYFGEQQSYIQNVDSYYKILRCYYGVIKDMITLIYRVERSKGHDQPLLIPLLSFGVQSIIKSDYYPSTVDGKPAKLICIRLPYQALANPARYLGPLAHELFHYSAPAKREVRNESMVKAVLRVAITEFVSILARGQNYADSEHYWKRLFDVDDVCRGRVYLDGIVERSFCDIDAMLHNNKHDILNVKLVSIKDMILKESLCFSKHPEDSKAYEFYYRLWRNLRRQIVGDLLENGKDVLSADDLKLWMRIFGLDENLQDNLTMSEDELRSRYASVAAKVDPRSIEAFEKLLYNTLRAMEECPADIFDLETVLANKDHRKKIVQYLWQINGAKRDETLQRRTGKDNQEEWPPVQKDSLLANQFRNAMIIHYYMNSYGESDLSEVLQDWTPETSKYKAYMGKVKEGFLKDYQDVMIRFKGLLVENTAICHGIAQRIRHLLQDEMCSRIMLRLTDMYERYYTLLEQRQRNTAENPEESYENGMFKLCGDLIDEYQYQSAFDVNSVISNPLGEYHDFSGSDEEGYICVAGSSADLSKSIVNVIERMKIRNEVPPLWFCGRGDQICRPEAMAFGTNLHAQMVVAIRNWSDRECALPEQDAVITVLNPDLFNCAMALLEDAEGADVKLLKYLQSGITDEDAVQATGHRYPRAVMTGEGGLICLCCSEAGEEGAAYSLEVLQRTYRKQYRWLQHSDKKENAFENVPFVPFLHRIELNHLRYVDFKKYIRAIGIEC